jgi:hypothetical protein
LAENEKQKERASAGTKPECSLRSAQDARVWRLVIALDDSAWWVFK